MHRANAATRAAFREIAWPQQARLVGHVFEDFFAVPAMVAACDDVDAIGKQIVGDFGCDTEAGCRVLAVGDDEVDLAVCDEVGQPIANDLASRRTDDIPDKEYAHR